MIFKNICDWRSNEEAIKEKCNIPPLQRCHKVNKPTNPFPARCASWKCFRGSCLVRVTPCRSVLAVDSPLCSVSYVASLSLSQLVLSVVRSGHGGQGAPAVFSLPLLFVVRSGDGGQGAPAVFFLPVLCLVRSGHGVQGAPAVFFLLLLCLVRLGHRG